ncbi:uncharacterized protein K02A2.6 [Trichonephila clavipes]|nr:uncharacterized protein K02A2.6 [Trichonephila clavipes]
MSRFGGLSEERPSVFKTPCTLGIPLSTLYSVDEGRVDLAQPLNRTPDLWCGRTIHYHSTLLASDASPVNMGCVLSHVYPDDSERSIAFALRTLSAGSEKKYSQINKETLSIVWAVKRFYLYLKGRRFTLITDHKPLIAIFGSKRGSPVLAATRLLHYALILLSLEFSIIFPKTIEHGNADFLSRLSKTSEELEVINDIKIFQMSQIEALPVTSKEL